LKFNNNILTFYGKKINIESGKFDVSSDYSKLILNNSESIIFTSGSFENSISHLELLGKGVIFEGDVEISRKLLLNSYNPLPTQGLLHMANNSQLLLGVNAIIEGLVM